MLVTLRDSGSLAGWVQRQDRRAWQMPALVANMLDLGTEARSCSPILVLTGRERGSCNGYTNDPRNIRPISGRPLALRRWSSAKNGERDGSGHPVACAYRGQGRALQAPRALALWPLTALPLLELHQIRHPHTGTARTSTHVIPRGCLKHVRRRLTKKQQQAACSGDRPRYFSPNRGDHGKGTTSNVNFRPSSSQRGVPTACLSNL